MKLRDFIDLLNNYPDDSDIDMVCDGDWCDPVDLEIYQPDILIPTRIRNVGCGKFEVLK